MSGILLVLAHPDDESFVGGGALTYYAERGLSTALLCFTDGQAGRAGISGAEPLTTRDRLGQTRREELRRAAVILKIGEVITPGWMDGQLSAIPDELGAARIMEEFARMQPEIVISFGPEGAGNQHPDHKATSRWALAAFEQAARQNLPHAPRKLYWITWPDGFHPIEGIKVQGAPPTSIIKIGDEIQRLKLQAFEQHSTQQDFHERFRRIMDAVGPREYFHLARSRAGMAEEIERDLYERINGKENRTISLM